MTDPDTISADYTLRPSELAATLALLVEARQPCVVWGPPGAAKSMIAQQVSADAARKYVDVRALLLDPVDLRGIPWRDADDRTRWAPPAFLPPSDDPGRCLVNLEELPSAVPMVQAALYQLAAARRRSASAPGLPRRPGRAATHDLALGDRHPEVAQLRDDPRYRHLARVILSEHEAPELGAEVADRPRGQSRHHRPTIRGDPAFTAVADHVRTQDQLLDHVGLVSLEPRAGGNGRLEHPLLVDHKPVDLATPAGPALRSARAGSVAFSMPLGLSFGGPLSPFSRAISSRNAAFSAFSATTSSSSCNTNPLRSSGARASISGKHPAMPGSNQNSEAL